MYGVIEYDMKSLTVRHLTVTQLDNVMNDVWCHGNVQQKGVKKHHLAGYFDPCLMFDGQYTHMYINSIAY